MHYRVIRDDQEYGPYTIEEITQYVQEGSILPNDYVHNGMEWLPVSQFLQNPHKAAASCLLYTSPSPRDMRRSRMPSSA